MNIFKLFRNILLLCALLFGTLFLLFFEYKKDLAKASIKQQNTQLASEIFSLVSTPAVETIKINFQDEKTFPPPGWLKDAGEPFSNHPGIYEGSQLVYGWKNTADSMPVSLGGNGRARDEPEDVLLSTFIHMQADDINRLRYGTFNGTRVNGYWELKVLNGEYKVTVATGDGAIGKAKEIDCINVEGVKAISNFVPFGKLRSPGRFKTATVTVTVSDGYLTIDAEGGTNTKICYVEVEPVTIAPYLYLLPAAQNLLINKDLNENKSVAVKLGNSLKQDISYHLTANYSAGATNWLKFPANTLNGDKELLFDYSAAGKLPVGTYRVKLQASAPGFSTSSVTIQVNVVVNSRPYVIASIPENGSCMVNNTTIAANNLYLPAINGFTGGINNVTINNKTVKLLKMSNGNAEMVPGNVQGTGGGDAISFSPLHPLEPNAYYKFIITSGVKSYSGKSLIPYESSFSTATAPVDSSNILKAEFTKVSVPGTQNKKYTALTFGPDGKFYALKIDGGIERYKVDHTTGMLSGLEQINTMIKKHGKTTAIGLTFDIHSTAKNLIAWVSYSSSSGLTAAPMFDGNISRINGPKLENEQQVIVNLPRSTRDHMVNSMAFGPDSALYISIGSNSSAGNYDKGWQRNETLLAGSVLRLDIKKLNKIKWPLDVKTTANQNLINHASNVTAKMADGTYNPYSISSPLTIYASGIRNAYDMVWHSNGQLYIPANGSGGGGNSPASVKGTKRPNGTYYNGPAIAATQNVPVQHDWLFRVNPDKPVGYFGHPNPLRGEYVINRGFADNPVFAPNVKPDVNYRGAAYDFGFNKSPNGIIEYKSDAFNGALKGKLLICRFSGGGDIIVLEPGSKDKHRLLNNADTIYNIKHVASGIGNNGLVGMAGFANPLDIVEDVKNGNLYISEFNWNENPNLISQITLLKVKQPTVKQSIARIVYSNKH
ncbi:Ig-like domain-containing protein [Mucilaginibacter sp.]|jgi:glucose/arabinose dehydrogenase|uniref:Ig-like domain-containing protein n=1 Tax=Mucilaginibacter sp. TaxID=1882438 RepID=UPI003569BEAE